MIESITILSHLGKVIVSRDYLSPLADRLSTAFTERVLNDGQISPVLILDGLTVCYKKHRNVFILAATRHQLDTLTIFLLLDRLEQTLEQILDVVTEDTIHLNKAMTLDVLDLICCCGKITHADPGQVLSLLQLKTRYDAARIGHGVSVHSIGSKGSITYKSVPEGLANITNHDKELILLISEKTELVLSDQSKSIESCIVRGSIQVTSKLNEPALVRVVMSNNFSLAKVKDEPITLESDVIAPDDIHIHNSVDYATFFKHGIFIFKAIDEPFTLVSYRLHTIRHAFVKCKIREKKEQYAKAHREYSIKLETHYGSDIVSNAIVVRIPVPSNIDSPSLKVPKGKMEYLPAEQCVEWRLGSVPGKTILRGTLTFGIPSIDSPVLIWTPVVITYDIPFVCTSGLAIKSCTIEDVPNSHASFQYRSQGRIISRKF